MFEIYVDVVGNWRWRYRARNGEIIAVSSEGYERRAAAERGVEIIQREAIVAQVR